MALSRLIPWSVAAVCALAAGGSVLRAGEARRSAADAVQRLDHYRQRVAADEAFIDGDRERAFQIYAGLAEATGDSAILRQRSAYDVVEREDPGSAQSSSRDFARLAARLERTEALLEEARSVRTPTRNPRAGRARNSSASSSASSRKSSGSARRSRNAAIA